MTKGRVTHAHVDGIHVLRYVGRIGYALAPAIKRFVDGLGEQGEIRYWIFDLTQAEMLDSTHLGLLVRIAERTRTANSQRSVIVSTNDDINCFLDSMGFDEIFEIVRVVPGKAQALPGVEIEPVNPSPAQLQHMMLDAHRTLMSLNETARLQFQDVVACMEADLSLTQHKS